MIIVQFSGRAESTGSSGAQGGTGRGIGPTIRRLAHATLAVLLVWGVASPAAGHGLESVANEGAKGIAAAPSTVESLTGSVEEIFIDDRNGKSLLRYRELRLDDGTAIALQGAVADALPVGQKVQIGGRRNGRTFDVESTRKLAAATASTPVTKTEELEGTLAIIHSDDFATGASQFIYELHDDGGRSRRLDLATLPQVLHYGMRLRVAGYAAARDALRPTRITILAPGPDEGGAKRFDVENTATTVNSVLVIMANFSDTAAPGFTSTQAQQVMTSNSTSVANYYNEVSFGQQALNVTVTSGWVTMGLAKPASCNNADWQAIGTAADAAAKAANSAWNPASYAFVVYVFPSVSACGWSGLAYIGNPHRAWINGPNSFVTWVVAHEMGHNFGLLHAASLRCTNVAIGGSCAVSEYGDPFDTMGNQGSMHFNARQKSKLNWIGASTVATHSAGTSTYTLSPIETGGGALYAIKIPTASASRTYWVEFRQPIGFDSPLAAFPNNGAQIRVASPFETLCSGCDSLSDDTQLLDMTPGTSAFTDAALIAGQTYSDTTYGISISVLAASSSALTVQVSAGGTQAPSSTAIASGLNPAAPGASVAFTATVTGTAPSGSVSFSADGGGLAGCGAVALAGSGNVRTAVCATASLAPGAHAVVAAYSGDAANAPSSSATLSQVVGRITSTTGIATSANPASAGSAVTFTATVSGVTPTGSVSFTDNASTVTGCSAVALGGGSGNVRTATCTTSGLVVGSHAIVASYAGDAGNTASGSPTLTQSVTSGGVGGPSVNVALAANGGVASASSTYSGAFPVAAINDNDRSGAAWGGGGGWNDATNYAFPDWVQVNFAGSKTIDRVVVYTLPDNYGAAGEPTDAQTFSQFGIVDFDVQAWNGSAWVTLATVSGNNLVKRTVSFTATTTDRVRVNVTNALYGYSRIVEVEAWMSQGAGAVSSSTALASSSNPAVAGSVVTLTATVTGASPSGVVGFTDSGAALAGCSAVALTGGGNVRTATCTTIGLAVGSHAIVAAYAGDAGNTGSISPTLTQSVTSGGGGGATVNVALAANGGVASASSTYNGAYPVAAINDNDRSGAAWGGGGGWNDATSGVFPDWVQVNFAGSKTIDRVVVYTLPDNYGAAGDPTDAQTFSQYGIVDFDVQAWNGSAWVTLATVSGNNLVKRTVTFAATTTDRVRVNVTNALYGYSRIVEVEAWASSGASSNVALAVNGGVASASSTYSGAYPVAAINDSDRSGAAWGAGGGWNDATEGAFPDWVQVNFAGSKTIDRVVLYTLSDSYGAPGDPTDAQTFGLYGIVDFSVQAWNGSTWVTLATVSGNNLVKRTVSFAPTTTDRVRVNVTNALYGYARIVELEAWGQ